MRPSAMLPKIMLENHHNPTFRKIVVCPILEYPNEVEYP